MSRLWASPFSWPFIGSRHVAPRLQWRRRQLAPADTTPPSETISSTIGTNTGSTTTIVSGGTTNDNTLALSGTVSDANGVSSVLVYDGATLLGPATVSSGNWSYTTAALHNGSHSFTAKATDNAGNTTTTSAVTSTVSRGAQADAVGDDHHVEHDAIGHAEECHHIPTIDSLVGTDTGSTASITSGGTTNDNTLALSGGLIDAMSDMPSDGHAEECDCLVLVYDGATLLGRRGQLGQLELHDGRAS